jgi:hypothetical protein
MPEVAFVTIGPNELEHAIRLASATVASGDTIHIWSVIRNAAATRFSHTISNDLLIGGKLALGFPRDLVALRSAGREQLPPGDSVVRVERRIVVSPPGRYVLTVRHVMEPEITATADILVRPRPGR